VRHRHWRKPSVTATPCAYHHRASRRLYREVLRRSLSGRYEPLIGQALFAEYESVLARSEPFLRSPISDRERDALLAALISRCTWVRVYYLWRPNLPDEADNHLVELAVAGNAGAIVTHNTRDFERTEMRFPELHIVTAGGAAAPGVPSRPSGNQCVDATRASQGIRRASVRRAPTACDAGRASRRRLLTASLPVRPVGLRRASGDAVMRLTGLDVYAYDTMF